MVRDHTAIEARLVGGPKDGTLLAVQNREVYLEVAEPQLNAAISAIVPPFDHLDIAVTRYHRHGIDEDGRAIFRVYPECCRRPPRPEYDLSIRYPLDDYDMDSYRFNASLSDAQAAIDEWDQFVRELKAKQ